jgi:hypothetical protein
LNQRLTELKEQFYKKENELTDKSKLQAIYDDEVCRVPQRIVTLATSLGNCYDWKDYVANGRKYNDKGLFDQKAYDAACKPLRRAAAKTIDYIMLGDEATALKLINEFIAANES